MAYSKDLPSPRVFQLWTAIHAVGAAAERRVWTKFGNLLLHPNLFVFLVGPPGTGKSVSINPMSSLLRKSGVVNLSPDDMTKQGLLDCLGESSKAFLINGRPQDYHFLTICGSELANFMSKYDDALAGILIHLFDCPPSNEEKKRGHDKGLLIPFPGISMIMGTATENLGKTISDEMWGSGFMARVVMVFSAEEVIPDNMFAEVESNEGLAERITGAFRRVGELKGPMTWTQDAQRCLMAFRRFQREGEASLGVPRAPLHNRLSTYVVRRWLHLAKLCMISALSEERMVVAETDFHRALSWLTMAETEMPEIFKDMITHEDGAIYEDLRQWVFMLHMKTKGRAIHASLVYDYLKTRAATHAVPKIIEIAEAAGTIRRVAGTFGMEAEYLPAKGMGPNDPGVI